LDIDIIGVAWKVLDGHKINFLLKLKYLITDSAAPAQLEKLTELILLYFDHFSSKISVYFPWDQEFVFMISSQKLKSFFLSLLSKLILNFIESHIYWKKIYCKEVFYVYMKEWIK